MTLTIGVCPICGEDWDACECADGDPAGEPIGSCEECMVNVYEDDYHWGANELLCDQCAWARSQ